ncbi:MAG TPA: hypothetical protein PK861_04945 [Thermomonas sp.]|nr:hypothetical protein [Thermomonas sp.]
MTALRSLVLAHACVCQPNPAAWVKRGKGGPARHGLAAVADQAVDGGRKANPGREAH